MLYHDTRPGQIKQEMQRRYAVEYRGKIYENVFLLPSDNPDGDLTQGKQTGIFKAKTRINGVEYHPDYLERRKIVKQFLQKNHANSEFIGRPLHLIKFDKYVDNGKIDYFGCDMCGNLTPQLAVNLFRHQNSFADGMRFPVTIKIVNRRDETQEAIEMIGRGNHNHWLEHQLKGVSFTSHFGMTKDLQKNMYTQIYMLLHSMPSKTFTFHRVIVYKNSDTSNRSSHMVFLEMEINDADEDIRRRNRFERILRVYAGLCPSRAKEVQLTKPGKVGRPRLQRPGVKKANTVPFHILLGFKCRKDMEKPYAKAKMTKLATKLAKETGRDMAELRGSMVAGMNRHWTEVSKSRKNKKG